MGYAMKVRCRRCGELVAQVNEHTIDHQVDAQQMQNRAGAINAGHHGADGDARIRLWDSIPLDLDPPPTIAVFCRRHGETIVPTTNLEAARAAGREVWRV